MQAIPSFNEPSASPRYHCGTLTYTKAGLLMLFAWLLWGDFCFTLMEAVVPSILPLKLKSLGCSNWLMGMIMTAAPGILNMTVCPYASFKSDRYRSRWGRRIPFILVTMPFLCISLILMGVSDNLGVWLQTSLVFLQSWNSATLVITLIAVFLIMFQFFNMFVNSVFWYLFNDVVPPQFLARFMGLFKIVGTGAGALYNFFIFQFAESHMREIFIGAALLYLVGFGAACLMIKEGQYPPPDEGGTSESKGFKGIITFFRESFSHRFYWFMFLSNALCAVAWTIGPFTIFFNRDMGLSLEQIGQISAIGSVAMMLAMYFMSVFVDRWHPLRISVYGAIFGVLGNLLALVWIFVTVPPNYFFWLNLGNILIGTFLTALVNVAGLPTQMRTFPQSRFGQFCSAQSMIRSIFVIVSGILAGLFIDVIRRLCPHPDFAYRFIPLWMSLFLGVSAFFLVKVYREWYRLGGDAHFHPPAPWLPEGMEIMPIVPIVGPQSLWLKRSFLLFDAIMWLSALSMPVLMLVMYLRHYFMALKWYAVLVLPIVLLGLVFWYVIRRMIWNDVQALQDNRLPRNGIPHHGMLIILGTKFLLAFLVWIGQIVSALALHLESGLIAFGIANAVINLLLVATLYLICCIERGFSLSIDGQSIR